MLNYFPIMTREGGRPVVVVEVIGTIYLWNILCVNTVYRIAHVLFCRHNEGEGEHARGGDAVVQPEHPAVDVDVRHV